MAWIKFDISDGLYLESVASDGSEALSIGLAALHDDDKSTPASPTNDYWSYHYAYGVDLGSVLTVGKLKCFDNLASDGWYSAAHDSVKVFKSDDNISYEEVEQFDGPTRINGVWELVFSSPVTARYFKVFNCEGSSTLAAPAGLSLKVTEIEAWHLPIAKLSGTVKEKGVGVERAVRCYIRSTGELFYSTTSNPDGTFELNAPDDSTEMFVIAFDDVAGDQYNALIYDRVVGSYP